MIHITACVLLLLLGWSSYPGSFRLLWGNAGSPSVTLDAGTFVGVSQGPLSVFRGIPYALPPVGDLRFRLPVANEPYTSGTHNATWFGASCMQQIGTYSNLSDLNPIAAEILAGQLEGSGPTGVPDGEDCLTVNVWAPANATPGSMLPVVFWIYGGGFENGTTVQYNGSVIVERSLQLDEPVVYVSVNYRLSALGFPGSAEVREAGIGNMGLHDQRMALRWVQRYITAFGGDPSRVTIWGQSAGAISVAWQMLINNGDSEGLFHSAFMHSGSVVPTDELEAGQVYFDKFAHDTGCGDSLGSAIVFDCLRNVPADVIRAAINSSPDTFSYQGLAIVWPPRIDGVFLKAPSYELVLNGSLANVPFVIGSCDDEGTLFGLSNSNITTEEEMREYIKQYILPNANDSDIDSVLAVYPADPTLGSPFNTGIANAITPTFKHIAAILGDLEFQAPRRFFLSRRPGNASAFSFLYKRNKTNPVLGAYHGSDIANVYGFGELTDAVINFATSLNPNGGKLAHWPEWTVDSPVMLALTDGPVAQELINDTYRAEGMGVLIRVIFNNTL